MTSNPARLAICQMASFYVGREPNSMARGFSLVVVRDELIQFAEDYPILIVYDAMVERVPNVHREALLNGADSLAFEEHVEIVDGDPISHVTFSRLGFAEYWKMGR